MVLKKSHIKGLILCGGKSRRFGTPKEHVVIDGVPLLTRAMEALDGLVGTLCLGVGEALEAPWPDVPLVTDRWPSIGPLGGIHAGIEGLSEDWLLVMPVDMPFMTTESLEVLIRAVGPDTEAVVACDGEGRVHPLCGLYHRSTRDAIEEAIERKEFAVMGVLSTLKKVRYVTLPDEHLRNVNRPEDLHFGPRDE